MSTIRSEIERQTGVMWGLHRTTGRTPLGEPLFYLRFGDGNDGLVHFEIGVRRGFFWVTWGQHAISEATVTASAAPLPLHRTEAGYPNCSTCDGGGCPDCTDPA